MVQLVTILGSIKAEFFGSRQTDKMSSISRIRRLVTLKPFDSHRLTFLNPGIANRSSNIPTEYKDSTVPNEQAWEPVCPNLYKMSSAYLKCDEIKNWSASGRPTRIRTRDVHFFVSHVDKITFGRILKIRINFWTFLQSTKNAIQSWNEKNEGVLFFQGTGGF